jgi:hypothetical protein
LGSGWILGFVGDSHLMKPDPMARRISAEESDTVSTSPLATVP